MGPVCYGVAFEIPSNMLEIFLTQMIPQSGPQTMPYPAQFLNPKIAPNRTTCLTFATPANQQGLRHETGQQARGPEYPVPYLHSGTPLITAVCMRRDQ
jgi:hypothetical protein